MENKRVLRKLADCLREKGAGYLVRKLVWQLLRHLPNSLLRQRYELQADQINIGFLIGGGLGDNLIFANYLYCLKERFPEARICADVYFASGFGQATALFEKDSTVCHRSYPFYSVGCFRMYDWFLEVSRCPRELLSPDIDKIRRFSTGLAFYVQAVEQLNQENARFFELAPALDGKSAEICAAKGIKRIQQPDFDGSLGIGKEFRYRLHDPVDALSYLASRRIQRPFFTFHRGGDTAHASETVKMWPFRYYEELIVRMRAAWPDYLFVQLGASEQRCPPMKGIDIHLEGETNLQQLKAVLKHSRLHIDGEGGMVHLRQALRGGPSVVIFGATSLHFFAYDGNLNLCSDGCGEPCEWAAPDWLTRCRKGFQEPPCMVSVTPELVMEKIQERFGGILQEEIQ